jgi:hypothetical protein
MCSSLSHFINTQLNVAATGLDTENLFWIFATFTFSVYIADPHYKANVEGHLQNTWYNLFCLTWSMLKKYVTCKYYSSFKNFANMQYKTGVEAPGLSSYQLSITIKHNPYDQWIQLWISTIKIQWPTHMHTPFIIYRNILQEHKLWHKHAKKLKGIKNIL